MVTAGNGCRAQAHCGGLFIAARNNRDTMFKKKSVDTMSDDAATFYKDEYPFAWQVAAAYLETWFESILKDEPKKYFGLGPGFEKHLALACMEYLLGGQEVRTSSSDYLVAKHYSEKWATDAMNKDQDFCRLVVQTARMDNIFQSYDNGVNWSESKTGGDITMRTIHTFGSSIPDKPSPQSYRELLVHWLSWYKQSQTRKH